MQHGFLGPDSFEASGRNYPLTIPSEVSAYLEDLAIDTSISLSEGLRLTWLAGIGQAVSDANVPVAAHRFDMMIQNEAASIVWDTRTWEYHEFEYGLYYVSYWEKDDTVIQACIRPSEAAKAGYRLSAAIIDGRAINTRSRPVFDFEVWNGSTYESATAPLDNGRLATLRRGYNVVLNHGQTRTVRGETVQDVTVNVIPGAGLGRFEACDVNLGISAFGGAVPTETGDLLITGDSCLRIRPKITYDIEGATVVDGEFILEDICQAGCQCSDFTELARYATATWNKLREIGGRAEEIRNAYHTIRDHMASVKECAESQPLRLQVWPTRPCEVAIMAGFCNPSELPINDVTVKISFKTEENEPLDDAQVHCDSIYRVDYATGLPLPKPYSFETPMPGATIKFDCIGPGTMGFVVFRAKFPQATATTSSEATTSSGPTTTGTGPTSSSGPTTTAAPTTTAPPEPINITVCLECPVGLPEPWKQPDELCRVVDITCQEDKECGPTTSSGSVTTTGSGVTTTGSGVTTTGSGVTTTGGGGGGGPTTTGGPVPTTPDYLTKEEGDGYYINDDDVIDGGHF